MASPSRRGAPSPKGGIGGLAARAASSRLVDVEYVGKMEAVVFRLFDGTILGVPLQELDGIDSTPVTRVSLTGGGDAAVVEQFSGNIVEVRWDAVLYHAGRARSAGRGTWPVRRGQTPRLNRMRTARGGHARRG